MGVFDGISAEALTELGESLAKVKVPPKIVDDSFPEQAAFIRDPARFKVLFGPRRIGKSIAVARLLLEKAWAQPNTNCLYLGLTLDSAKKAIWKDGLKFVVNGGTVLRDGASVAIPPLGIGVTFNETHNTCTLENSSVIYVMGADSTDAPEKIRGGKYSIAVVDEAASFSLDLRDLYFTILRPALTDYRGTMVLTGTPGRIRRGLFFDITTGQDFKPKHRWRKVDEDTGTDWSGHRWDSLDNPYQRLQESEDRARILVSNPRIAETPRYQEETLGQWSRDDKNRVYRYERVRNDFDGQLPEVKGRGRWHYVLGLDLAHSPDCAAICVGAYHDQDPTLYLLEGEQVLFNDITDIANKVKAYDKTYDLDMKIVDGSMKLAVAEFNNRHGLQLLPAEKRSKAEFIDLMNADFIQGRIKVNVNSFLALEENPKDYPDIRAQYEDLVWDERELKKNKRIEHPAMHNDLLDANLYLWRHCYQYLSERDVTPLRAGTKSHYDAMEEAMLERDEADVLEKEQEEREEFNERFY